MTFLIFFYYLTYDSRRQTDIFVNELLALNGIWSQLFAWRKQHQNSFWVKEKHFLEKNQGAHLRLGSFHEHLEDTKFVKFHLHITGLICSFLNKRWFISREFWLCLSKFWVKVFLGSSWHTPVKYPKFSCLQYFKVSKCSSKQFVMGSLTGVHMTPICPGKNAAISHDSLFSKSLI